MKKQKIQFRLKDAERYHEFLMNESAWSQLRIFRRSAFIVAAVSRESVESLGAWYSSRLGSE